MTTLLDKAIEAIRRLPAERQDELAQAILEASEPSSDGYSADQLAAIDEGIADADAGRFMSDHDLEQFFARYRAA
jgi:predicted transcriptional regulator